jgi:F-type H+-transporting ATPase subunit b
MPQLDFSTYPSQLFWLFVIFLGLWMVVSWGGALTPVSDVLSKRQETLCSLRQQAQTLQQQAKELEAGAYDRLQKVRQACEAELQKHSQETERRLKRTKMAQTTQTRQALKDLDRHFLQLKKEAEEEGMVVLPELESLLLTKLSAFYGNDGAQSHAA